MNKFLSLFNSNKPQQKNTQTDLVEMSESILLDTRSNLANKQYISLPLDQMATLGAGVASLLPAFRTVTQTTSMNVDGLYRLANATVGDTLKVGYVCTFHSISLNSSYMKTRKKRQSGRFF